MYALTDSISDLLGMPIAERGVNAMLRCPLHEDDSPSFSIHLEEGVWHCFGCERSGNINTLYRLLGEEVSLDVRMAQAKKRTELPDAIAYDFTHLANNHSGWIRQPSAQSFIRSYTERRGIPEDALSAFRIGYDPQRDALTFPYFDIDGRVTGIKYRYRSGFKASETGSVYGVYGLEHGVGRTNVIICEGESDTIGTFVRYAARSDYGVCGTSGASVSEAQWTRFSIHFLFAQTIYLAYDGDDPGDKCAETAMRVLGADRCRRLRPPDGTDLTEFYMGLDGRLEDLGLE